MKRPTEGPAVASETVAQRKKFINDTYDEVVRLAKVDLSFLFFPNFTPLPFHCRNETFSIDIVKKKPHLTVWIIDDSKYLKKNLS